MLSVSKVAKRLFIPREKPPLTARQRLRDFCDTTEVHGFAFAADSLSWFERLLYIALTALFIGLTIRDIVYATRLYYSEPTSTNLQLKNDRRLDFDHVTVCVPIMQDVYRVNKTAAALVVESWNDSSITVADLSSPPKSPEDLFGCAVNIFDNEAVAALLDRLTANGSADILERLAVENLTIGADDAPDLQDLFHLTLYMIGQITVVEQMHIGTSILRFEDWEVEDTANLTIGWDFDGIVDSPPLTALKQTYEFYTEAKVNMTELLQVVAEQLCVIIGLGKTVVTAGVKDKVESLTCSNGSLFAPKHTWLSVLPFKSYDSEQRTAPIFVCYSVPNVTVSAEQHITLSVWPQNVYKTGFIISDEDKIWLTALIDLSGSENFVDSEVDGNALEVPIFNSTTAKIALFGEYQAESTRRAKCSEDLTYTECRLTCRANYALRNCGCWPLSLAFLTTKPDDAKLCPFVQNFENGSFAVSNQIIGSSLDEQTNDTTGCLKMVRLYDPDPDCTRDCPEKCKNLLLMKAELTRKDTLYRNTEINILGSRYIYPTFTEELTIDATTYFSNLGGILGLWIGASFLAIIHVAIYSIRTFIIYALRWKNGVRVFANPDGKETNGPGDKEALTLANFSNGTSAGNDDEFTKLRLSHMRLQQDFQNLQAELRRLKVLRDDSQ